MNKHKFILLTLLFLVAPSFCFANSLDDLYRDLIRSDNEGYLPMFVKNRNAPDFLLEDEVPEELKKPINTGKDAVVDFSDKRKERELALKKAAQRWEKIKNNVKLNIVTPYDLEEIRARVEKNDIEAIEIYAYMNARGVGINQDLITAFNLYKKAMELNIPQAKENATMVYRHMSKDQKKELNSSTN